MKRKRWIKSALVTIETNGKREVRQYWWCKATDEVRYDVLRPVPVKRKARKGKKR